MAPRVRCHTLLQRLARPPSHPRATSSLAAKQTPSSMQEMLSRPTWSVQSLREPPPTPGQDAHDDGEAVTPAQLRHLLRLAALPQPACPADEEAMLATLRAQLRFVRAVQRVDTAGVAPLCAIRDETAEGARAAALGLADLRPLLDKEATVGYYGRPRRVKEAVRSDAEDWDALSLASKKAGKYFVVESGPADGGVAP